MEGSIYVVIVHTKARNRDVINVPPYRLAVSELCSGEAQGGKSVRSHHSSGSFKTSAHSWQPVKSAAGGHGAWNQAWAPKPMAVVFKAYDDRCCAMLCHLMKRRGTAPHSIDLLEGGEDVGGWKAVRLLSPDYNVTPHKLTNRGKRLALRMKIRRDDHNWDSTVRVEHITSQIRAKRKISRVSVMHRRSLS